jgi:hypothetical protein
VSQILGVLLAIILSLPFAGRYLPVAQQGNQTVQSASSARVQTIFADAVRDYTKTYYTTIEASATESSSVTITVAMLQAVGLLSSDFTGLNAYGQTLQAQVLQPTTGNLVILVFGTGGTTLGDKQGSELAGLVSAAGGTAGLIPVNDSKLFPSGTAYVYGAYGQFSTSTSGFSNITAGRVASVLYYSSGQLVSNYLYRNAVSGQPQLNQMNTALDMNTYDITNVGDIETKTMTATGQVNVAKLALTDTVTSGAACSPNGNISQGISGTTANVPMVCQLGLWKPIGQGLGDGQSWYDETGSRCASCVVINDTGRAILVSVSVDSTSGGQIVSNAYVNDVRVGSYNINNNKYDNAVNYTFVVPAGQPYYVTLTGDNNVIPVWAELR